MTAENVKESEWRWGRKENSREQDTRTRPAVSDRQHKDRRMPVVVSARDGAYGLKIDGCSSCEEDTDDIYVTHQARHVQSCHSLNLAIENS